MKLMKGIKTFSHDKRLSELGLFSLENRRLGGRKYLIKVHKYLRRGCKEDKARLFSGVPSARTRDNGTNSNTGESF